MEGRGDMLYLAALASPFALAFLLALCAHQACFYLITNTLQEAKNNKDRDLIHKLVTRAEDRERVFDSPKLLNNAVEILSTSFQHRVALWQHETEQNT
jgi:hypothetical protein